MFKKKADQNTNIGKLMGTEGVFHYYAPKRQDLARQVCTKLHRYELIKKTPKGKSIFRILQWNEYSPESVIKYKGKHPSTILIRIRPNMTGKRMKQN